SIAVRLARIAAAAGLIVFALWLLIHGAREGMIRWRAAIALAIPAALAAPVEPLLSMRLAARSYDTARPFETFQVEAWLGVAGEVLGSCMLLVVASALVVSFYPRALHALRRTNRRLMGVDAALAALAAAGLAMLVRQFDAAATASLHAQALVNVSAPD